MLTEDMRFFIWLDYDDRSTTGLDQGLDHLLMVDVGAVGFGAAGLAFCGYPGPSCGVVEGWRPFGERASLRFSYENGVAVSPSMPRSLHGGSRSGSEAWSASASGSWWRAGFATTLSPDAGTPRTGAGTLRLLTAPHAGFPERDQFWVYESRSLLVKDFSTVPATPRAGKPFALRLAVIHSGTGAALSGAVSCSATNRGQTAPASFPWFCG